MSIHNICLYRKTQKLSEYFSIKKYTLCWDMSIKGFLEIYEDILEILLVRGFSPRSLRFILFIYLFIYLLSKTY